MKSRGLGSAEPPMNVPLNGRGVGAGIRCCQLLSFNPLAVETSGLRRLSFLSKTRNIFR